eukprot:3158527-Prymnesium_polylepis.1
MPSGLAPFGVASGASPFAQEPMLHRCLQCRTHALRPPPSRAGADACTVPPSLPHAQEPMLI